MAQPAFGVDTVLVDMAQPALGVDTVWVDMAQASLRVGKAQASLFEAKTTSPVVLVILKCLPWNNWLMMNNWLMLLLMSLLAVAVVFQVLLLSAFAFYE